MTKWTLFRIFVTFVIKQPDFRQILLSFSEKVDKTSEKSRICQCRKSADRMKQAQGITERLKAKNALEWVGQMNTILDKNLSFYYNLCYITMIIKRRRGEKYATKGENYKRDDYRCSI